MSVVKADMIDGMAADGNTLVLAISDHLIWDREKAAHLSMLQGKLNKYICAAEERIGVISALRRLETTRKVEE